MDRITKSLLDEFKKQNSLMKLDEDKAFEHFCCGLLVGRLFDETVDISDAVIGGGNDLGIDAVAIVVNGQLVLSPDQVKDILVINGYLDVEFVFIQSETSSSFDGQKLGNFIDGVEEFFSDTPELPRSLAISTCVEVMEAVYRHSSKFKPGNPKCTLYYCTTGRWTGDTHLDGKRRRGITRLAALELFRSVEIEPVDSRRLQMLTAEAKNALSREFVFDKQTVIPDVGGVEEAYLGVMPASEYLKLITDEDGKIAKSVFYDNVRDWQDFNSVNSEIRTTLGVRDLSSRFALMNNGVTILARTLKRTADKFHIENYQIVNGCQTSHVLFACKDQDLSLVNVPVRLISTSNEEIINSIIKATNRQTTVSEEQLLAVSDFQKQLENYLGSFDGKKKLYYERRSRQYSQMADIEKVRIISMTNLIRAFSATFLDMPHQTMRSYKSLLNNVGKRIFAGDHKLEIYYAAAYALYKIEFLFRNQSLDARFRPARYQMLMLMRVLIAGDELPALNSRKAAGVADKILVMLQDEKTATEIFKRAATIVELKAGVAIDRDTVHTDKFTRIVKGEALSIFKSSAESGAKVIANSKKKKISTKKHSTKESSPKKVGVKKVIVKSGASKK